VGFAIPEDFISLGRTLGTFKAATLIRACFVPMTALLTSLSTQQHRCRGGSPMTDFLSSFPILAVLTLLSAHLPRRSGSQSWCPGQAVSPECLHMLTRRRERRSYATPRGVVHFSSQPSAFRTPAFLRALPASKGSPPCQGRSQR
jgi:hypothetical protein